MEDKSVFNRLIKGLSREERLEMLKKIHNTTPVDIIPLKNDYVEEEYNYENSYKSFGFLEKLVIFFTVLFTTKEKERVIEDLSMVKLARQLEKQYPGLINYSERIFLSNFSDEIKKLRESLLIFRNTLPVILKNNEIDFIAFLVGLHFPEIETKLLDSIDPMAVGADFEFESSFQLKRHIEFHIDEILGEIDTDKKKIIYREIKNLHILNALTIFNFDNILSAFTPDDKGKGSRCGFIDIRKSLHQLIDILFSLNVSPAIDTLNAVFMFSEELKNPDSTDGLENILKQNMEKANTSLDCIRQFNNKIPLESILCLVNRNMNFHPAHIGGAEDWYALFRRFWYKKFDYMMGKYTENEKRIQLEDDAAFFLNLTNPAVLPNYKDGLWGDGSLVKFKSTIGFIFSFMLGVFQKELNKALKLVLIDGQFYKEQNRLDYNSSYQTLIDVSDLIKEIESKLSSNGEYYLSFMKFKSENDNEENLIEIQKLKHFVDNEFRKIIINFNQALDLIINVISGIVQGEMGGVYDTLSNLGYIGKGENKDLLTQLNDIRFKLDEAKNISYQLYDLENSVKT